MKIVNHIYAKYNNFNRLNFEYTKSPPYPHLVLDEFLPGETVSQLKDECNQIEWTREFTRNGSRMLERQNITECPIAYDVFQQLSSQKFLKWLGSITGHDDLIPDPHMIGAGYMRCSRGDSLKIHSDFNYNNTLGLYRMLTLNIYLNKDWQEKWNGDLQFWDFDRKKCVSNYFPEAGRAVLFRHHKYGFHGHPNPLECPEDVHRDGLRIFYYVTRTSYKMDKNPHRSLYWFDEKTGEPYDIESEK